MLDVFNLHEPNSWRGTFHNPFSGCVYEQNFHVKINIRFLKLYMYVCMYV